MRFDPDEFKPVALENYREELDDYVAWLWANFYQRIFPEWTKEQQARARDIDELPGSLRNVLTGILTGLSTFTADMLEAEVSRARFTIEEQFPGLIDNLTEWGPTVLRNFRDAAVNGEPQAAEVDDKRECESAKRKKKEEKQDKKRQKEEKKKLKKREKKDKKRAKKDEKRANKKAGNG